MKRTLTCLLGIGLFTVATFAQLNIEITDVDGNIQNEGTYVYYGDPSTSALKLDLFAESMSSSSMTVNVKRYETNVQAGTKNFFCWGLCYAPVDAGVNPVWVSIDVVEMAPNVLHDDFSAYHQPQGLSGVSCYRYVWYDVSNEDDSTWVDICFDTETVGVPESGLVSEVNVFPNPSLGNVNFDIALNARARNAELVIHNLLGEQIWSRDISRQDQLIVLNDGELGAGVYFYSIRVNGEIAKTDKMIIASY